MTVFKKFRCKTTTNKINAMKITQHITVRCDADCGHWSLAVYYEFTGELINKLKLKCDMLEMQFLFCGFDFEYFVFPSTSAASNTLSSSSP